MNRVIIIFNKPKYNFLNKTGSKYLNLSILDMTNDIKQFLF